GRLVARHLDAALRAEVFARLHRRAAGGTGARGGRGRCFGGYGRSGRSSWRGTLGGSLSASGAARGGVARRRRAGRRTFGRVFQRHVRLGRVGFVVCGEAIVVVVLFGRTGGGGHDHLRLEQTRYAIGASVV